MEKKRKLNSIACIRRWKQGDKGVLKEARWLIHLAVTAEENINLERLHSMEEKKSSYVLDYVERTLLSLEEIPTTEEIASLVEETLIWSEVAKGGTAYFRKRWLREGVNLFVHNKGSAEIYFREAHQEDIRRKRIVHTLIGTHGLIGQYIRGEVTLEENLPLEKLLAEDLVTEEALAEILKVLNCCILSGVEKELWHRIEKETEEVIEKIIRGAFREGYGFKERLRRLRKVSIENGEDFEASYDKVFALEEVRTEFEKLLAGRDLWFVEGALYDFTLEEFVKIFLLIGRHCDGKVRHISFEPLMKDIYYQHEGRKRINIYKKRIIENFLGQMTTQNILAGNCRESLHVSYGISFLRELDDTLTFTFCYSPPGEKLIEFCVEAEKADILYESAIVLLFDLFGLRKDKFDRFYEEESYLKTMNQSIDYKKIILEYIKGDRIIDIGPGGGALMDLIEENAPGKQIVGIDISQNVLESLNRKKQLEKKEWEVMYGDALNLGEYLGRNSVDTIIFCSILHELFSYIEFEGRKFNYDTLAAVFKSAFEVLKPGGRIIIRDGVMAEEKEQKRIIRFLSEDGMEFLKRYACDFKGREIQYEITGQNEAVLFVNDAMEFLYTYTWGEKSYVHEVNEQFGYFTPQGFREFIGKVLGDRARIITLKHFLQEGYTIALSQKIELFDESRKPVRLPDSTCLVVIEKES